MRKFLVYYYNQVIKDWEFFRVKMHPNSVKNWLRDFESSGFLHAYEVLL